MDYSFRTLNSADTFLMFKIIGKIGINEFSACLEKDSVKQALAAVTGEGENKNFTALGISVTMELANVIIKNLPNCESEIYQLLANVSNATVKQIKELDFITFTEMILDFIAKEEFRDFIKVVSRRFRSEK